MEYQSIDAVFWIDDAYSVTQQDDALVDGWSRAWPTIRTMVRRGAKIVLTSRDYIYNRVRDRLKEQTFPLLNESQVVIDVRELSDDERGRILYNHIKLGNQPASFRTAIKPFLEEIAVHPQFVPETARRLGDTAFTKSLPLYQESIRQFVERREQFLQETIRGLDAHSRAILALIFLRKGRLLSPIELRTSEERAIGRLGSDLAGCTSAATSLDGSFVNFSLIDGEAFWQFRHPTIGDAYSGILADNPEYLAIFVAGSDPSKLVAQITCGDVGIERATIVPGSLFCEIMAKLDELDEISRCNPDHLARYTAKHELMAFLARRCADEFLQLYLERHPDLPDRISKSGMSLNYVPEVPLTLRLQELALLPDENRKQFLDTVSRYLLDALDAGALSNPRIRNLYQQDEFDELIQSVRDEILPDLDEIRDREESNWDRDVSPEDWMQPLKDFFDALSDYFQDEQEIVVRIDDQLSSIESWIVEHSDYEYETEERSIGPIELPVATRGGRSIFDDIDAD